MKCSEMHAERRAHKRFGNVVKIIVAGAAVAFACSAQAETYFDGQYVWNYRSIGNSFVEICRGEDCPAISPLPKDVLYIPSMICGKPVTSIGAFAFSSCSDMIGVAIPNTVRTIGEHAFYSCKSLRLLSIPYGVENIERSAFCWCSALTEVTIPDSVTSIGHDAFAECFELTNATLSANLKNIPEAAFYETRLRRAIVPNGVTNIDTAAFSVINHALKTVSIPKTVVSIGEWSFVGLKPDVVYVANGDTDRIRGLLKDSGDDVNGSFNMVEDSEYAVVRDDDGHDWTYRITCGEAEIGNGIKSAIYSGTEGEVSVPEHIDGYKVTRIAANAFIGCSKLTAVNIPSGVKHIGDDAFFRCSGMANSKGLVVVRDVLYGYFGTGTSVKVPSAVKRIVALAFSGAKALTDVTIGDDVVKIGDQVFFGCQALESIHVGYGRSRYVAAMMPRPGTTAQYKYVEPSQPTVCIVKFDANGGECDYDAAGVAYGKAIGALPGAERKGYSLAGWYTQKTSGTKLKKTTTFTKKATCYARWTTNIYKIKFNSNGGKGKMETLAAAYDKTVKLTANAFTRKNCTFKGWSKKKDATEATYANKAKVSNLSSKDGGTVTLYAVWKHHTYTVKFDANGGNGKTVKQKVNCGESTALDKNTYTCDGYRFAGWATTKNGPVVYKNKAKVTDLAKKDATVTLYAVWKPAKWALGTFTGTGKIDDQKMTVTLTVSSEGKISGKFVRDKDKKTAAFKADDFEGYLEDENGLWAKSTMKFGSKKYSLDIRVTKSGLSDDEGSADIEVLYKNTRCGRAEVFNH